MRARLLHLTGRGLPAQLTTTMLQSLNLHHERIDNYHISVACFAHAVIGARRADSRRSRPAPDTSQLASFLDQIAEDLTGATDELEQLLESLSPKVRRENVQAIAMLSRAHDDCCRELAEAQIALRSGNRVQVLARLARLFAAVGRAAQAHYYLRTAAVPAA